MSLMRRYYKVRESPVAVPKECPSFKCGNMLQPLAVSVFSNNLAHNTHYCVLSSVMVTNDWN